MVPRDKETNDWTFYRERERRDWVSGMNNLTKATNATEMSLVSEKVH